MIIYANLNVYYMYKTFIELIFKIKQIKKFEFNGQHS